MIVSMMSSKGQIKVAMGLAQELSVKTCNKSLRSKKDSEQVQYMSTVGTPSNLSFLSVAIKTQVLEDRMDKKD